MSVRSLLVRSLLVALVLALLGLGACRSKPADDGVCRCTPGNRSGSKLGDGSTFDGNVLLGKLRRHRRDALQHRNPRDIKVDDDELRLHVTTFCQPCSDWVNDHATLEALFPLDRLDDAAGAVCLGLVLRDGTTAYGEARPRACR